MELKETTHHFHNLGLLQRGDAAANHGLARQRELKKGGAEVGVESVLQRRSANDQRHVILLTDIICPDLIV